MKIFKQILITILVLAIAAGSIFTGAATRTNAAESSNAVSDETEDSVYKAGFYIQVEGKWETVGVGLVNAAIIDNVTTKHTACTNADVIKANVLTAFDLSKWENQGYDVEFYRINIEPSDRNYVVHVDLKATKKAVATSTPAPTATSTPAPTATNTPVPTVASYTAGFYILVDGKWDTVGAGEVAAAIIDNVTTKHTACADADLIKANVLTKLDLSKWENAGYEVSYYRINIEPSDSKYVVHVDMQATKKYEAEPVVTNTPVPTATNTPVPTATNTPVPTATNTPAPTATNTPVPTVASYTAGFYILVDGKWDTVGVGEIAATIIDNVTTKHTACTDSKLIAENVLTKLDLSKWENAGYEVSYYRVNIEPSDSKYVVHVDMQATKKVEATSTPAPTATNTPAPTATSTPKPTATSTPKPTATSTPVPTQQTVDYSQCKTLEEVYVAMLENGEMGSVDISRFKATYASVSDAWNKAISGEGLVAYNCGDALYTQSTKSGKYLVSTTIAGMDENFLERYALVKKSINDAMSLIQPGMTDLDKALVLHDYIVDKAAYVKGADGCYRAWGILAYGKGVCMSYSSAYVLLLNLAGIETSQNCSDDMNHIWTLVKIDGQWYQADATWDDTRLSVTGKHYYFLRTDNEFENVLDRKHYSYRTYGYSTAKYQCTDTRFENWFVHDIKGNMVYSNGYWYYADGNKLMKAHIDGSDMQVVSTESSAVTVVKSANGTVTYKVSGTTKTTTK